MFFIITMKIGSLNTQSIKDNKRMARIEQQLDSLTHNSVSKEEFNLIMQIYAAEIKRDVVYDNNSIVRTVNRPDDVMQKYNKDIEKAKQQLKEYE